MAILDDLDRFKKTFAGFVRVVMNRVDYCAMYPCTVAAQNADGTLELTPDLATKLGRGLSSIKYKPGIPGVTVTVAAGARVLLGFENYDPQRPYACGWDQIGTVTALYLNASVIHLNDPSGTAPAIGRVGDQVQVSFTPAEFTAMVPTCAAAPGPVVCTTPVTITGTITAGSGTVKSG